MRHARALLLGTLLCVLAGCTGTSTRIAAWYITRSIAGYFDLTSAQKAQLRATVDETIVLVRKGELSHWITLLREVRQGFRDGMTDERLAYLQRRYDDRIDVAEQQLVPRAAPLLVQLSDAQLDHFAKRMKKDLAEQYEDLQMPVDERREKREELEDKAIDLLEDFVGSFSDAQEASVRASIRKLPSEREAQYRSALDNLAHFRAFMRTRPTAPALEAELHAMWQRRYDALGPGHDKAARRAVQRAFMLSVFALLTPKQRAHAEEELSERIVSLKRWVLPPG